MAPSASHLDADNRESTCSAVIWQESRGAACGQMYNTNPEKGVYAANTAYPGQEWGEEIARDYEIYTVSVMRYFYRFRRDV